MERIGQSIAEQFERHHLYRRLIVLFCCFLMWYVTVESFDLANNSRLNGMELVGVITAIQSSITVLMSFITRLYFKGREENGSRT